MYRYCTKRKGDRHNRTDGGEGLKKHGTGKDELAVINCWDLASSSGADEANWRGMMWRSSKRDRIHNPDSF
jgi:hypothetical protein